MSVGYILGNKKIFTKHTISLNSRHTKSKLEKSVRSSSISLETWNQNSA